MTQPNVLYGRRPALQSALLKLPEALEDRLGARGLVPRFGLSDFFEFSNKFVEMLSTAKVLELYLWQTCSRRSLARF